MCIMLLCWSRPSGLFCSDELIPLLFCQSGPSPSLSFALGIVLLMPFFSSWANSRGQFPRVYIVPFNFFFFFCENYMLKLSVENLPTALWNRVGLLNRSRFYSWCHRLNPSIHIHSVMSRGLLVESVLGSSSNPGRLSNYSKPPLPCL